MNNRHPLYFFLALLLAVAGVSCNSDSYYYSESENTSAAVNSFSLKRNDSVLMNLDSVFFSIDLVHGRIFNADSLPKGTKISRLLVQIGTPSISGCKLTFRDVKSGKDSTVNYLSSPNDSIDFSGGPVKLSITSADGLTTRDYYVEVNVHKNDPDTLYWDKMAMRRLPTTLANPAQQKTLKFKDKVLCLTVSASGEASLAQSDDLLGNKWDAAAFTLPAGADIESFTASDDALYILGGDGTLYKASDPAQAWTSTGAKMTYVYGAYGTRILGNLRDATGNYNLVTFPATTVTPLPDGFPVSGTSDMLSYSNRWSLDPMVMMLGGRLESGKRCEMMWGYDGANWACISSIGVPPGDGIAVCRYPTFRVSAGWKVERRDAILAIGGRSVYNEVDELVYVSYDEGITWLEAADYLRLPEYINGRSNASLIVESVEKHLTDPATGDWQEFPSQKLPPWVKPVTPAMLSRVSAPITEWQCPYIYMFGGLDDDRVLYDELWRGVINRLTFNPLY